MEAEQPQQHNPNDVIVKGKHMESFNGVRDELLGRLVKGNGPDGEETLFIHNELPVRLGWRARSGELFLDPMTPDVLHDELTEVCRPVRMTEDGEASPTAVPGRILAAVRGRLGRALPVLQEVRHVPYLTPDGEVVGAPGYRADTGILLAAHSVPPVADKPTRKQVGGAIKVIAESFGDFTYADQPSTANALAMLLTPIVRSAFPNDRVPLALVSATGPRAGKSLLCEIIGMVASAGNTVAVNNWPESDAEFRKRIMPQLEQGNVFIHLDNVSKVGVQSGTFAAILTADRYSDRIITTNRVPEVAVRATFVATGINLVVSAELTRRSYLVDLEPFETGRKWTKPGLTAHVRQNWPVIVCAVLTLARAWYVAGQPGPAADAGKHDFSEWRRVTGGILGMIGVPEFLGNADALKDRTDVLTPEWTRFLAEWHGKLGETALTTSGLLVVLVGGTALDDAVPTDLAAAVGRPATSRARETGKVLARWAYKPLGGFELRKDATVAHGGNVKWIVAGTGPAAKSRPRKARAKMPVPAALPVPTATVHPAGEASGDQPTA